jgi:hypothetical protein
MKNFHFIPVLISAMIVLLGCDDSSVKSEKLNLKNLKSPDNLEDKMAAIENNPNWKVMNSLAYNNNAGSTEEVIAYLDDNDGAVKLEERYSDVTTGNYGTRWFYVSDQKTFASREVFLNHSVTHPTFIERISFYDKQQQPVFTRERSAATEIELENKQFRTIEPISISIKRAIQVINQQGEFATTFQGFLESGGVRYILVGENEDDGFASSLVVQYENEDIKKLKLNERGLIGTPLQISHQTMVDENGLKFQILVNLVINS